MRDRFGLSHKEEIWIESLNAISHGLSALLALLALFDFILLIKKAGVQASGHILLAYCIYGLSLIILFLNSTLYHALTFTRIRPFLQKMDHVAIYLLIAGTFTPYLLISLNNSFGLTAFIVIWILAGIGILFEFFMTNKFPRLSTLMYIGLGWLGLIMLPQLWQAIAWQGLFLLASGGLLYTIGTIFYSMKHNKWMHVIWHGFVSLAALLMFLSIYYYV